jgi:alkylation response protein AidB-like acyl-CoA dehydrogenase
MRFAFDDEQQLLQETVRAALAREAPIDRVRAWTEENDYADFTALAARAGWTGLGVAETDGGQGGGLVEQAILFEEFGRAAAPSGGLLVTALAAELVHDASGALGPLADALKGLEPLAVVWPAGRAPDRSVVAAANVRNTLDGGAAFVLEAPGAHRLLVPAGAPGARSLWSVDAGGAGVTVSEQHLADRTRRFADVRLEAAPGERLGTLTEAALRNAASRGAVLVAAESLGLARRMLEMTVGYVRGREQFGVAVGSFQAVKHAAAQALVDIEAAHSGVYYAAWALESGRSDGPLHAWIAKAFVTEMAARTADLALQLHGAIGYTWEYDLHVFFKRAKAGVELMGSPRHYRDRVADALDLVPAQQGGLH